MFLVSDGIVWSNDNLSFANVSLVNSEIPLYVNLFSKPSILYETSPAFVAINYFSASFNCFSYLVLSSIKPFNSEPAGLSSPTILAFL